MFVCVDCNDRFASLKNLNMHIRKTGCNNDKILSDKDYLIKLLEFI